MNQSRNILLVLILGLGIFLIYELRDLFSGILGAIVMYTLFKPFYQHLHDEKKLNKGLSAGIMILISLLIIVIPFIGASFMIINKIGDFKNNPGILNEFIQKVNGLFKDPQFLQHKLQDLQQWGITLFSQLINSLFKTIFSIVIMYFILYFMLTDNEIFESTVEKYIPLKIKSTRLLSNELRNITRSCVVGQAIIACAQAICVIIGFSIFQIPDPFFWGFIAAFLAFIPLLGVPSMFIGASIYSFMMGEPFAGSGILLWGFFVIAVVENYLRVYIGRRIANAHPLIIVIGVLIGIPTFGIVGIVFGPLLLSYFILLISIYERNYSNANKKNDLVKQN